MKFLPEPGTVGEILEKIRGNYDYIVVDTSNTFNDVLLNVLDRATKIVLVSDTSLPAAKSARFVLDLYDQLGYDPEKTIVVLNKVWEQKRGDRYKMLSSERIEKFLKRPVAIQIPHVDERFILNAVTKGIPVIAAERDQNKPPIKQLLELSAYIHNMLMGDFEEEDAEEEEDNKRGISLLRRGR